MKFLKAIRVKEFREMLDSIQGIILSEELISLDNSYNRVISRDIISPIQVPHFRKSRMDGYAVIAEDTFNAEEDSIITLALIENIQAGDKPQKKLKRGQCSYVATGAALPENADGVVMVEFSDVNKNDIQISKAVTPGMYVINIGHDVKKEDIICKKGTLINLPTMGILSSCGIKEIDVFRRPKVSLISTGNEIVPHEIEELEIGKIYDINSIVLKRALINAGADVKYLGIIKDNYNELKQIIEKGLNESDIVILSGGTSKGEGDLGPSVLKEFNEIDIMVHGVRIKPGKPIIFSKIGSKVLFILPGYPTSALSCYYVFIEDFLRKMSGYPLKERISEKLEVGERIYSTIGRHEFKPVKILMINDKKKIFPIKTGSEAISTIFNADGYIEIDEMEAIVEKGDKKNFYLF